MQCDKLRRILPTPSGYETKSFSVKVPVCVFQGNMCDISLSYQLFLFVLWVTLVSRLMTQQICTCKMSIFKFVCAIDVRKLFVKRAFFFHSQTQIIFFRFILELGNSVSTEDSHLKVHLPGFFPGCSKDRFHFRFVIKKQMGGNVSEVKRSPIKFIV